MGEKGNGLDGGVATGALADPSLIERVTTTTTQTVVGASEDLVSKIQDKALDHGADAVVEGARRRLGRGEATEEPSKGAPTERAPMRDDDDDGTAR